MLVNPIPITLVDARMITPRVKHFIFNIDIKPAFTYQAGQFITIHFEHQGKTLRRSYSIANVPEQNNRIEFAASYVEGGPGTTLLYGLEAGDVIYMTGAFGRLILKEDEVIKRHILVATSTGITPYRAMIADIKKHIQKNSNLQFIILQGVPSQQDILYEEDFYTLTLDSPNVLFRVYLSREQPTPAQKPYLHHGYVQHAFNDIHLKPNQDKVYLCGNPTMIDEAFTYLQQAGFSLSHIVREKYISSK